MPETSATYLFNAAGKTEGDSYELVVIATDGNGEQRSGSCRVIITK
jgi:hypothetical protein